METSLFSQRKLELQERGLYRSLRQPFGLDFCSNDYLGFSANKNLQEKILNAVQEVPLGSTGSRLLRGHSSFLAECEQKLAAFSGQQSALFFGSGYQANLGLFSCLAKEDTVIFSDELIHASIIDGIRLSGCEKYIWAHNDVSELELLLKRKARPGKLNIVVVESIYSMRGDFAPLVTLADLCSQYGAHLIVDEAHATGLFGLHGAGRVSELNLQSPVFASVHTAGKSLGVSGAWIATSQEFTDYMINHSRPFIYSTAPAFYQQVAVQEAIAYLVSQFQELRQEFMNKAGKFQEALAQSVDGTSFRLSGVGGPVSSLVCGDVARAVRVMDRLAELGFDVRAIRPPSVPKDEALLRITIPLSRTDAEIHSFAAALKLLIQEEA